MPYRPPDLQRWTEKDVREKPGGGYELSDAAVAEVLAVDRVLAKRRSRGHMMAVRPHPQDIDDVTEMARDAADHEVTAFPGMTYEDGILAMYRWLTGEQSDPPLGAG